MKTSFFKIAPARASVQKPIAIESVDVASPKMAGSKKKFHYCDGSAAKSVDFVSQKGVETNNLLLPVKTFCFFVKFENSYIS